MNAEFILQSLMQKYNTAAFVPEVVVHDESWRDLIIEGQKMPRPTRRIDALMWDSLIRTAIEIKVSRADFMRDTWQKIDPWRRMCHRVYYAVPENLITIPELNIQVGQDVGLWFVDECGKVVVARKAKVHVTPNPIPQQIVQALAYRAQKNYKESL